MLNHMKPWDWEMEIETYSNQCLNMLPHPWALDKTWKGVRGNCDSAICPPDGLDIVLDSASCRVPGDLNLLLFWGNMVEL